MRARALISAAALVTRASAESLRVPTCIREELKPGVPCMTAKQGPKLIVRRSHFDHPKCKLTCFIEGHPFNSALQVILPGAADDFHQGPLAHTIAAHISGRAYHLLRCNLAALADEDFVERHVRPEAAHFCALSVNTPLDRTDAAAVLPDGRLVLAVTDETHQKLGLVGLKKAGKL